MKCPKCSFENPTGMKFCGQCGELVAGLCPECGFANPLDFLFCGQCGTRLVGAPGLLMESVPKPGLSKQAPEPSPIPLGPAVSPPITTAPLAGERRQATILLADLTGSTDLLERIGTEAWVGMMNRVLQILETEVYRFGGEVDQFRGDGLVAFFGAKSAHEDDPERAVLSAMAMQRALKPFATELSEGEGIDLLMRVGVNTGEVIVASIGDHRQHSEDTAMGEAIALAARIEAAAKPGTVLVGENTYRLVESQFEWEPLGQITAKGISQPVAVYHPLAARPEAVRLHGLRAPGLSSPLIGLDDEFDAIQKNIQDLRNGRGGILMISGDVGLGKSRLVTEVHQHLIREEALMAESIENDPPPEPPLLKSEQTPLQGLSRRQTHGVGLAETRGSLKWLQGRCRSFSQSLPYSMWIDLLRGWLGVREEEPQTVTRDRLHSQAETLWGDRYTEHYPTLATLLSLPLEETQSARLIHLDAESMRYQFFLTIRSWVEAMSKLGPLVVVFSDVHWVDASSLDLLEHCLPLCDNEMVLWLIVFRPDRSSLIWDFHHHVETEFPHRTLTLTLSPLDEVRSGELVDRLTGYCVMPAETRAFILDKAEGNPYYIEEIIRSLISQEILVQDNETCQYQSTQEVDTLQLPDTLQSLLLARIDALSLEERRVLHMAAVIGSVFWSNVLHAMVDKGAIVEEHLRSLQRTQMIHERGRVSDLGREYVFKSTLIRDAAYESILLPQRVAYHRLVADYLAQLFGEETQTQNYGVVARHYRFAEDLDKELFYTIAAAEQAQRIYANAEAQQHYTHALALLDRLEQIDTPQSGTSLKDWRLEALRGLGQIHFGVGEVAKAEGYFRTAIALGRETGLDPHALVRLYYWLGEVLMWLYRFKERIAIGEEGLALLGEDTESVEAALMNQTIAMGHFAKGDREIFREFTYRTAQFIQSLPYSPELRPAYDHIIIAYREEKNIDEAMKWIQALEWNAEQHHDLRASGEVHSYTADTLSLVGDMHGAISRHEQALELFRRIGDAKHEGWSLRGMGRAFLALGDLRKAAEYAWNGLKTAEAVGSKGGEAEVYLEIGHIFLCQGLWDKAVDAYQKISQLIRETGTWIWRVKEWADYSLGRAYLAQGDRAKALRKFKAVALAGSEILMSNPQSFAHLLSGLEQAYRSPKGLHTFRRRFLEKFPEAGDSPFTQWFLEPTNEKTVHEPCLFQEEFTESLLADWGWEDPFGDCSFAVQNGLEIHAVNGRNLLGPNLSAPRMLRSVSDVLGEVDGADFAVQTVCVPISPEKPAIGGILIWKDKENWLCLERGDLGTHEISFRGCLDNKDLVFGRGRLPVGIVQDKPSDRVYLRLERVAHRVNALCSTDGDKWFTVGYAEFPEDESVKVGLHAIGQIHRLIYIGAYPEGTGIKFESFQMWRL